MQKKNTFIRFGLAAVAGVAGLFASPINWSSPQNGGLITQAQARVGNPLTPGSIAGVGRRVERRTGRRAYRGAYYGTGAAIGAAGVYRGSQYYNSNPGGYSGAYTDQSYATYPGQYYGTGVGRRVERRAARRSYRAAYYGTGAAIGAAGGYSGAYTGQSYATYPGQYARAASNENYGGSAFAGYSGLTEMTEIANWCASRYKSYNSSTGTFLGYDGRYHSCP